MGRGRARLAFCDPRQSQMAYFTGACVATPRIATQAANRNQTQRKRKKHDWRVCERNSKPQLLHRKPGFLLHSKIQARTNPPIATAIDEG